MKKQIAHILAIILIFSVISCKSYKNHSPSSEIVEVYSSSKCGDKGGRFHFIQIRKDSTIMISGFSNSVDTLKSATDYMKWNKMTKLLNVEDFTKLKNGKMGSLKSDGCISRMSIKTKDSVYSKYGIVFNKLIEESRNINDLIR